MLLFDTIMGAIAPHECLGCGQEGCLVCEACQPGLVAAPPGCYRCRISSVDFLTCADCRTISHLVSVRAVAVYTGLAKELVWKLKFAHAQSAAREMASLMSLKHDRYAQDLVLIVAVPTATTRIRRRGYDQARLLARHLARYIHQPCINALARQNQAHQVGASRQQRLEQLAGDFRVTRPELVRDAHIILVDDVVTTGATLEAAAKVLQAAGAKRVEAVVFAQPKLRHQAVVS